VQINAINGPAKWSSRLPPEQTVEASNPAWIFFRFLYDVVWNLIYIVVVSFGENKYLNIK
jgi:hypothetical protein